MDALSFDSAIEADLPEVDFFVDRVDKPLIFIAGGIGITPFRSILLDLEKRGELLNIQLLYANNTEDAPFRAELEGISRRQPNFKIKYYIGKNRLDASGLLQLAPSLNALRFYISGPEPMVESFDKILKELTVSESNIQNDFFPGYDWP